ncbi:MAG: hypothetical protein E7168_01695 [Firmicutes bacterium]|nr:hypothetical protein [Bacillota bacterium]
MKKEVILRKIGNFYNVFDEDALILEYLFQYKVINGKVGFPLNAFNKVVNTLTMNHISYRILDDEENSKIFKRNNQYMKFLEKAHLSHQLENQKMNIMDKLSSLTVEQLQEVLEKIEKIIYE